MSAAAAWGPGGVTRWGVGGWLVCYHIQLRQVNANNKVKIIVEQNTLENKKRPDAHADRALDCVYGVGGSGSSHVTIMLATANWQ